MLSWPIFANCWLAAMLTLVGCAITGPDESTLAATVYRATALPKVESLPPTPRRSPAIESVAPSTSDFYGSRRLSLPKYARLALQPADQRAFLQLPSSYYAVQLFALSAPERVEKYVVEKGLIHVSAAQVEHNGQLLYVLLLGIYETRELANAAIADLPEALAAEKAWIRPLKELQEAVQRADRIMGHTPS